MMVCSPNFPALCGGVFCSGLTQFHGGWTDQPCPVVRGGRRNRARTNSAINMAKVGQSTKADRAWPIDGVYFGLIAKDSIGSSGDQGSRVALDSPIDKG